jgi:hypothetical protein
MQARDILFEDNGFLIIVFGNALQSEKAVEIGFECLQLFLNFFRQLRELLCYLIETGLIALEDIFMGLKDRSYCCRFIGRFLFLALD